MPSDESKGSQLDAIGSLAQRQLDNTSPTLNGGSTTLGETTFDVYLNARTFWRNVPPSVWRYKLGGYQVLKKWLSYRERSILNRPLKPEEIQHFADTGRRISTMALTRV